MLKQTSQWTNVTGTLRAGRASASGALGAGIATATTAVKAACPVPDATSFRVRADVRLRKPGEEAILSVGCHLCSLGVIGDATDRFVVRARAWGVSAKDLRGQVEYRLSPDVNRWAHDEPGRETFSAEFAHTEPVSDHWLRLAVDITPREIRAWVDSRLVAFWETAQGTVGAIELELPAGSQLRGGVEISPIADGEVMLPVDLGPYAGGKGFVDLKSTEHRGRHPRIFTSALSSDPKRALFRIPRRMYDLVHLVCTVDTTEGALPSGAVVFIKPERGHSVFTEFTVNKPYDQPRKVSIPLDPCAFSDFLNDPSEEALEVDFCQRISFDEGRFPRPAGPRSGVRIHEMTFETAPVALKVTSPSAAHLFEGNEVPRFFVHLTNQRGSPQRIHLSREVTDPYGGKSRKSTTVTLAPWETVVRTLDLPQAVFGRFGLTVQVAQEDGSRPLARSTTFARLRADSRKATAESPFGMWCFLEGHHGAPTEVAAPLLRKAGARWTLANFVLRPDPEETRRRTEILARNRVGLACANVACIGNTCNAGENDIDGMIKRMHEMPPVEHWLVFWETFLSRQHMQDFPFDLIGKPVRPLTDEEEAVFQNCWDTAIEYSRRVRKEFPTAKLIYGNGHPNFIAALLRRGFPKEYIDGFGLDFDMFVSSPELQPGPLHCPFNGLYFLAALQRLYGYAELPRYLTEAIYCSQSDGWLTERQQADYYVRSHLLGLASGVVLFGMTAELWDPGSEFFFCGYGPVGLLHRPPEMNPRESFCAYATMTRVLDGASFEKMLPMPSPGMYGLLFRERNGQAVHAFWTTSGERTLTFSAQSKRIRSTDLFGNTTVTSDSDGVHSFRITPSPIYVEGEGINGFTTGTPRHRPGPKTTTPCVPVSNFPSWQREGNDDAWMERLGKAGNWAITAPTIRGEFDFALRKDRKHGQVLRVSLLDNPDAHPLHVHYCVLRFPSRVPIKGSPAALGVWIRGNSSSARILFEFTDARGKTRRSVYSDGYVDFDGWRYVQTPLPLPATMDGCRLEPVGLTPWATEGDDKEPALPIALTALVIEARTHVIRATDLEPVPDRTFDVSDIVTTREMVDPEIRFRW